MLRADRRATARFGAGAEPRSHSGPGRTARSRALQGEHQGPRPIRRPPAGHRAQPRRGRMDRARARRLRLHRRAPALRLRPARRTVVAGPYGATVHHPERRVSLGPRRRPRARRGGADIPQQRSRCADRSGAARAQRAASDAGAARGGLLHQGRRDASGGNVHRRRPHGWTRLRRGGGRRCLRCGAGHGTGPRVERAGRHDRPFDPLRAVEQRGDRAQRRLRLCAAACRVAGQGEPARLRPLSGAEMARDDPARHDAVGSRPAAPRRHGQSGAAGWRPTSTSSSRRRRGSPIRR